MKNICSNFFVLFFLFYDYCGTQSGRFVPFCCAEINRSTATTHWEAVVILGPNKPSAACASVSAENDGKDLTYAMDSSVRSMRVG